MKKQQLIDAICGSGFRSMNHSIAMEKVGLAGFCGNQWNPDWSWNRKELKKLTNEQLDILYTHVACDKEDEKERTN